MSLLPRNFLINDAYLTELGDPIKPAVYVEPPKPPADDWTCAVASDNPPKPKPKANLVDAMRAASSVLARRKPKPWTDIEAVEPANPKPAPKSARPFQPGDLVRILDGKDISDYTGGWVPGMSRLVGAIFTVKRYSQREDGRSGCYLAGDCHVFDTRGLELVQAAE